MAQPFRHIIVTRAQMSRPSLGLAHLVVRDIFSINKQKDQVLESGVFTLSGDGRSLLNDESVSNAYLGT